MGQRTYLTRGGGGVTYGYDNLGRLTSMFNDLSGSSKDVTWTFAGRNPAGQITNWAASSANYDYVEAESSIVPQTYDGLNRDAAIATLIDGYDARGNLTHDAPNGTARYFAYDILNRLLTKKLSPAAAADLSLKYDPEGRLSEYTVGSVTTEFLYDGTNLIGEYQHGAQSNHTVDTRLRFYVHSTGVDEPIVWFEGTGYSVKRYFVNNYQGSVIGYTDSGGSLQETYTYGPYGEPGGSNGWSSTRSRFTYTGQTILFEAQLYYYKARVYDPRYGHFMQTDPIGSKDDINLYSYTRNDPINNTDPTGLDTVVTVYYYIMGNVPIQGDYGHAYVGLKDTDTGVQVLVRGGPSLGDDGNGYTGGVTGAILDRPANGSYVYGEIADFRDSTDTRQVAEKGFSVQTLTSKTIKGDVINSMKTALGYLTEINKLQIPYRPRSDNSNRFAFGLFNLLTGSKPPKNRDLPGFDDGFTDRLKAEGRKAEECKNKASGNQAVGCTF